MGGRENLVDAETIVLPSRVNEQNLVCQKPADFTRNIENAVVEVIGMEIQGKVDWRN